MNSINTTNNSAFVEMEANELQASHLLALCNGSVLAIRIPGFVSPAVIERAREKLFFHCDRGALTHAKEFTRLGIAYAEIKSDEMRNEYHRCARENIERVRELFTDLSCPVDRFRILMDDVWPPGANLLSVNQQKCFVGVCRYLTPGVNLDPHIDSLEWTLPRDIKWKLEYQLSANIYLQVPEEGGELEIWNIRPDPLEYERMKGSRHYGMNRSDVKEPDLVVKPEVGDLLILNPRFVHAVRAVTTNDRITLSSFIGIKSETDPLVYWS
jgi:hypothetical protein